MSKVTKHCSQLLRLPVLMIIFMSLLGCALSPYERCDLVYDNRNENVSSQNDVRTAAAIVTAAYILGVFMPECKRGQQNSPNNIEQFQSFCTDNECSRNEE